MKVIEFIISYWDIILLIVAAVVAVVFSVFKGNKSVIMRMLYALVTEAERAYGGGKGEKKLEAVIETIYPRLPLIIKLFITDKMLVWWIEKSPAAVKKAWEENPDLISKDNE